MVLSLANYNFSFKFNKSLSILVAVWRLLSLSAMPFSFFCIYFCVVRIECTSL